MAGFWDWFLGRTDADELSVIDGDDGGLNFTQGQLAREQGAHQELDREITRRGGDWDTTMKSQRALDEEILGETRKSLGQKVKDSYGARSVEGRRVQRRGKNDELTEFEKDRLSRRLPAPAKHALDAGATMATHDLRREDSQGHDEIVDTVRKSAKETRKRLEW